MTSRDRKRKPEDDTVEGASSSSSEESSESSYSRSDHKKQKRRHKSSKKRRKKSKRSHERSNDIDDEVESSSAEAERRSKKRQRKDDHSVSSSSSHSYSSSDRRSKKKEKRRSKDKKRKSDKKKKKKRPKAEIDDDKPYFGKYGILKSSDYHKKSRSFTVWLEEVKGVTDAPKYELQNYFKDYMEDFNTATLPHKKFYDYDTWEREEWESKKAAKTGSEISSARQDEVLHKEILQVKAEQKRKQELELVKSSMSKEKREEMKRKAELLAEMAHAYKTGDQETYLKLKNRLEPER